jgi:hypothetical protein
MILKGLTLLDSAALPPSVCHASRERTDAAPSKTKNACAYPFDFTGDSSLVGMVRFTRRPRLPPTEAALARNPHFGASRNPGIARSPERCGSQVESGSGVDRWRGRLAELPGVRARTWRAPRSFRRKRLAHPSAVVKRLFEALIVGYRLKKWQRPPAAPRPASRHR